MSVVGGRWRLLVVQDRPLPAHRWGLRMTLRQLIGTRRWSIALITNIERTPPEGADQ